MMARFAVVSMILPACSMLAFACVVLARSLRSRLRRNRPDSLPKPAWLGVISIIIPIDLDSS
jgi:hypothetical protein